MLAVVLIDMQYAYFEDEVLREQQDRLVRACNELLDAAAAGNAPAFLVRTEHQRDGSSWTRNMRQDGQGFAFPGTEQAQVVRELHSGEWPQIVKTRDSAFFGTSLRDELTAARVDGIILGGVSTENCIAQTAADAFAHGFDVFFARDALGTSNEPAASTVLALLSQEYRQPILDNSQILKLFPILTK